MFVGWKYIFIVFDEKNQPSIGVFGTLLGCFEYMNSENIFTNWKIYKVRMRELILVDESEE